MTTRCVAAHRGHEPGRTGRRPRAAVDGLQVCLACRDRFRGDLRSLPELHQACERMLVSRPPREKVSGRDEHGITAALEAADLLRARLVSWCDLVVAERGCAGPRRSVGAMAEFLCRHSDWLCAHPAAGDVLAEVNESARDARRAAYPHLRREFAVGPCVEPDCDGTLVANTGPDEWPLPGEVRCEANPVHVWPAHRWRELDRQVHRGDPARNRWLAVADVAGRWNLSTGNVYRLASVHGWRRRTAGRRVFYYENDVAVTVAERHDVS